MDGLTDPVNFVTYNLVHYNAQALGDPLVQPIVIPHLKVRTVRGR